MWYACLHCYATTLTLHLGLPGGAAGARNVRECVGAARAIRRGGRFLFALS